MSVLLQKLSILNLFLLISSLLTIYKSFFWPNLDYSDVHYDQPNNSCLSDRTVQYNAPLAITGVIRGTSKEKLYQELGLESLKDRRWLRQLSYFYKLVLTKLPPSLYETIPPLQRSYRYHGYFQTLYYTTALFQNSFLPFAITEWKNLNSYNKNSYAKFHKKCLQLKL